MQGGVPHSHQAHDNKEKEVVNARIRTGVLIILLMAGLTRCTPRMHIPEKPIHMTVSTVCKDVDILAALIRDGHYERFYREVFSDSLKQTVSLAQFRGQMTSFVEQYGPLRPVYSEMQSCQQIGQTRYQVSYVLQYKTRTVFSEFIFSDQDTSENPKVLLQEYHFVDR